MKRLFSLAALIIVAAASGCAQQLTPDIEVGPSPVVSSPSNADVGPKSTRRDILLDRNFVSLEALYSGGIAGIRSQTLVGRKSIRFTEGSLSQKEPATRTVFFTDAERKQLLKLLNDVHFTKLIGKYDQPGLVDGIQETVTLTTTGYGKTNTYVISNYGEKAPQGFYKVTAFLSQLHEKKTAKTQ